MAHDFDMSTLVGLTDDEVAERLRIDGSNDLPTSRQRSVLEIALEVVREPMFLLLIGSGTIYLLLGDLEEALFLLAFVVVIMGITLYQTRKTERALEALRDLSSPRALVIRGGERRRISGRDVVVGDIVLLAEGDRVPADAVVLDCVNLSVDESLLTGESVPVRKLPWDGEKAVARPGGDDLPFVYSGTLIVTGQGLARAHATGTRTELGKIGRVLEQVTQEQTILERETRHIVRTLAGVGLALCVAVVVVYGFTQRNWLQGVLAGITMAMAILPEEFPVALTIFLALGAWRLSRSQVLTRRTAAVETLGAATVLCVDKTGTLTQNRMSVAKIYTNGQYLDVRAPNRPQGLPEAFHEVVEFGILASRQEPFDPMEKAFRQLGFRDLARTEHLHGDWTLVREYPLSQSLLAMSQVWKSRDGEDYAIAAKGAPEAIFDLCHVSDEQMAALEEPVALMASEGLRLIAVARARFRPQRPLPPEQHDYVFEFLGLLGLADPIRPTVPAAIRECYEAGIRVVMITGDYPGTAENIAAQIGLGHPSAAAAQGTPPLSRDEYITGPELDAIDDDELRRRIATVNIFARVVPEQKLRLVNALKANGEVVAMTGDGVNDAPALKVAHIGIAMGGRGSDVARESASLVLLDDDFSSIVKAVRLGRRIFDNLKKAMTYIFAIHVPIAGLSLLPVILGWPLVLLPVHIVFLELIIDPACSVVFEVEPEEADVMRRPPRDPGRPLLGRRMVTVGLLQGASVLIAEMLIFGLALAHGRPESVARALAFTTLVFANVGLIFGNRTWSGVIFATLGRWNAALWLVSGLALGVLALVLYVPFLTNLFRFSRLDAHDILLCAGAAFLSLLWFEIVKYTSRPATTMTRKA
jgi:Ca2+-transporting ATPase